LVTIREPRLPFPVVVALNRDERLDRETLPFGRHWPGEPFRGGKDRLAGGTWAGLHDAGFGVFVLNGEHALGPLPGKRSRGQLVLDLLRRGSWDAANAALLALAPAEYRPFHLVIASGAGVVGASVAAEGLRLRHGVEGVTMWTAHGADTDASARQRAHRRGLESLAATWRASGDATRLWADLAVAMAAPAPAGAPGHAAMCLRSRAGFGTRSSLLVGFDPRGDVVVRVAEGPPDTTPFHDAAR
jgi:uncharacterized protein with NRDE domain